MKPLQIAKGILTFVPGLEPLLRQRTAGLAPSADYSYGVWMKHLTLLWAHGMTAMPDTVAELGPGDSLGIGLSSLLSGAKSYCGLDVRRYTNTEANLALLDQLLEMFRSRAPSPSEGWPKFDQLLDAGRFPRHVLADAVLEQTLSEDRVSAIRKALSNPGTEHGGIRIRYMVPWSDPTIIERASVDLVISQSVLEHVVDLAGTYSALAEWIRPGGRMSHQIDFSAHDLAPEWNGHWKYSEWYWRLSMGKRLYSINREPCSRHLAWIERNGFQVTHSDHQVRTDGLARSDLSPKWKGISDHDLSCSSLFVQARKPS